MHTTIWNDIKAVNDQFSIHLKYLVCVQYDPAIETGFSYLHGVQTCLEEREKKSIAS